MNTPWFSRRHTSAEDEPTWTSSINPLDIPSLAIPKEEPLPEISQATKDAWWEVFKNAIYSAVVDDEAVLRARDLKYAASVAEGARNLADAAVDAFEERFGK